MKVTSNRVIDNILEGSRFGIFNTSGNDEGRPLALNSGNYFVDNQLSTIGTASSHNCAEHSGSGQNNWIHNNCGGPGSSAVSDMPNYFH